MDCVARVDRQACAELHDPRNKQPRQMTMDQEHEQGLLCRLHKRGDVAAPTYQDLPNGAYLQVAVAFDPVPTAGERREKCSPCWFNSQAPGVLCG